MDRGEELGLDHAVGQRALRREAGDQASIGVRQDVVSRPAMEDQRRAEGVEVEVGAQAGELRGTIEPRVRAPGFVVVPVERGGERRGHG